MQWLTHLLLDESIARTLIMLTIMGAAGVTLGRFRLMGVSLGVAGVLFAGLALGHCGVTLPAEELAFVREVGLVLFVYSLGLQIGPGFAGSLRQQGARLNLLAAAIVALGVLLAVGLMKFGWFGLADGLGVLAGAVTNTPSLAATEQALRTVQAGEHATLLPGLGYAVAYPGGILGIILSMLLVRWLCRVDVAREVAAAEESNRVDTPAPRTRNLEVTNSNLSGRQLKQIPGLANSGVIVSRFSRDGIVSLAQPDMTLRTGDILHAVGPEEGLDALRVVVGREAGVDLKSVPGPVISRRLMVTKAGVAGRPLGEVGAFADGRVVVTRVARGGLEFAAARSFRLQFGDVLMVVGEAGQLDEVAAAVGNSPKALETPQLVPFLVGLALGVLVGSIPVAIPGLPMPLRLGLAGGPLVVAILLSRLTAKGTIGWHLPGGANHMLRELGIMMFLGAVGLKCGGHFVESLAGGEGLRWLLGGALLTLVPLVTVGLVARLWLRLNYAELCGVLAGAMTDPPALAFAQNLTKSDAPAVAYAAVYPLTMVLRVMAAQIVVLLCWGTLG